MNVQLSFCLNERIGCSHHVRLVLGEINTSCLGWGREWEWGLGWRSIQIEEEVQDQGQVSFRPHKDLWEAITLMAVRVKNARTGSAKIPPFFPILALRIPHSRCAHFPVSSCAFSFFMHSSSLLSCATRSPFSFPSVNLGELHKIVIQRRKRCLHLINDSGQW